MVGVFESVVAVIPIVICFQSLILDMAGNVGTQSLAVTIRVLMDENLKTKEIKLFVESDFSAKGCKTIRDYYLKTNHLS